MEAKFMPLAHCAALGWAYGRLAAIAPELATPGRYSNALNLPLIGWGELNNAVMKSHGVPADLQDEMSAALVGVGTANLQANAEGQTAFALAYYRGLAGEPLDAPFDVAAARKRKGLTQQQLADALGVDQSRIAKWESGVCKPRPATLAKIKALLA